MAHRDEQLDADQPVEPRGGSAASRSTLVDRVFHELDRRAGRRRGRAVAGVTVVALLLIGAALFVHGDRVVSPGVNALSATERGRAYAELGSRLRGGADERVFEALLAGLSDPDRNARKEATIGLLHAIVPGPDPRSADRALRGAVAALVSALQRPVEVDVASADDPWSAFLAAASLSEEEQVLCILVLLEDLSPQDIAPYALFVLTQVDSPSPAVRAQALRTARSTLPDWSGMKAVVAGFLVTGGVDEKISAMQAIQANPALGLSASVRALISDPSPTVRLWAVHTLASLGVVAAAGDLATLANDPVIKVRVHAASALSELGFTEWNAALIEIAKGTSSDAPAPTDRADALRELRGASEAQAAPVGIAILSASIGAETDDETQENPTFSGGAVGSDSSHVLMQALRASVASSDASADLLISMFMDDDDPMVVIEAAVALHKRGVPAGTNRLIDWISGDSQPESVRRLAITAAERLGGAVFKPALKQVEQGDAAPTNREAASEALDEIGAGGGG